MAAHEREVFKRMMPFKPFPAQRMQERGKALEELLRPCARFNSPLSYATRWRLRHLGGSREHVLARDALVLETGAPLNWQLLLAYLREMNITDSNEISFSLIRTDLPHLFAVRLMSNEFSNTDGKQVPRYGFGSTSNAEESISRAIGELLERYALSTYRRGMLHVATYKEMVRSKRRTLDIFQLNDFAQWQKDLTPAFVRSDARPISWVRGRRISDGASVFLPAQLVFWNYKFDPGEMVLGQPDTNGCAGHFTREEAVLSGLLELIQRDGFLIYWLNGLAPKRIEPSTFVDPKLRELLAYLNRYKLEYYFLNTTSDVGVPSCTCVLIDRYGEEPVIAVGGGTGFSFTEIITQSVGEALAVLRGVSERPGAKLPPKYRPFRDPEIGRATRLALWRGTDAIERFSFFLKGRPQSFEAFMGEAEWHRTPSERLAYIEERLRSLGAGYEPYVYDASHEALKTLGFYAVRVIVPRLMHLYLNEHLATLAAPRLREVPAKLGYRAAEELTPWPHPFP